MTPTFAFTPRRWLVAVSPLLMLLCLVLIVVNVMNYRHLHTEAFEQRTASYEAGTIKAASALDKMIVKVEQEAEALAAAITDGSLPVKDYEKALAEMLQRDPLFYGGAIAFAPYAFDPGRRLYAPYFARKDNALEFMYIEESYDYTDDKQEWFVKAMASGSRWSDPYFDASIGDILMTTYSAVVYKEDESGHRQAIAVVTIDVSLEALGNTVKALGLGSTGYAEIVNDKGVYLYTPTESRVLNQESLFDSHSWAHDNAFELLQQLIANSDTGLTKLYDPAHDTFQWVSVAPIPTTPWHIIGNFTDTEVESRTPMLRHVLMYIILGTVLFLFIALLYKQVATPGPDSIISWTTSILLSVVLIIGIGQIWLVSMKYSSDHDRAIFPVINQQAVAREIRDYNLRASEHLTAPPLTILTGIYIESMKFLGPSDLQIVGSIWQKYDIERHRGVERGIIFQGAAKLRMSEPVVLAQGDSELVRWQFSGEWRFKHYYMRYPLVKDVFGIGLFPRDIDDNILLLPDVDSYPYLVPSQLPGLSPDVFLLGWRITNTYFELHPWQRNTTFGRPATLKNEALPELYFSSEMEKVFINSVISSLTPLAIAMTITFIVLLISSRDKARLDALRTGVGFDIGICTSIFFVVVLSHIGLRANIVSDEVFYLEYFYLLMYCNLLWVCFHSILSGLDHSVLEKWTFGVSAKKVYFPINFLAIFGFTWLIFYS